MANKEEKFAELQKKVKRANASLRAIEKREKESDFFSHAKAHALHNIDITRSGDNRFRANRNMSYNDIEHELRIVNAFLNSKTRTARGVEKVVNKRLNTFMGSKHNFTRSQVYALYEFFEYDIYKRLGSLYGSDKINQLIKVADTNNVSTKDMADALEKYLNSGKADGLYIDDLEDVIKKIKKGEEEEEEEEEEERR